jgi:hypothetical protein
MIRVISFTIGCALLACGTGWRMFSDKYQLRQIDRQIEAVNVKIRTTETATADLQADYEALNDRVRLQRLAEKALPALRPSLPTQTLPFIEFERRLPAIGAAPEPEPAPVAQIAPPISQAQIAPPISPAPVVVAAAQPVSMPQMPLPSPIMPPPPAPVPAPVQAPPAQPAAAPSLPPVPRPPPHPVAAVLPPVQPKPAAPRPALPPLPTLPVDLTRNADAPPPMVGSALGMARSLLGAQQAPRR